MTAALRNGLTTNFVEGRLEEVQSRVLSMMRESCDLSFRGTPFGGGRTPYPLGPKMVK